MLLNIILLPVFVGFVAANQNERWYARMTGTILCNGQPVDTRMEVMEAGDDESEHDHMAVVMLKTLIDAMAPPTVSGKKPAVFTLNGERFYIGSDVGYYMNCLRGKLYKFYPNLWRRVATQEEKKIIHDLTKGEASVSSNVMLVRASEVEEILAGNDEKYRTADSLNGTPSRPRENEGTPVSAPRILKNVNNTPSWNIAVETTDQTTTMVPVGAGKGRPRRRDHIFDPIDKAQHDALLRNAKIPEELVPIRLDLDIDGLRVRDTFCYNKNESLMTPEQFAEILVEDLEITAHGAVAQIAASIKHQLAAHDEAAMQPLLEGAIDQRAQIKVSVNVQNENLTDILEWDLAAPENSPEEFSMQLCKDLQIGGEFVPGIATAIRSQIVYYRKTFAHTDMQLPTVSSVHPMRAENDADVYGPKLEFLSDADLEKKMRDCDRNTRRMRRLAAAAPY
uniref:SWI/SNF-related matrix-associated actin-dependent regulator of chromatin subfamily B member 1 n=1 Tax=Panagrellus redivivus TaxID=6233 RepID=A0A7E4UM81_PANRE